MMYLKCIPAVAVLKRLMRATVHQVMLWIACLHIYGMVQSCSRIAAVRCPVFMHIGINLNIYNITFILI